MYPSPPHHLQIRQHQPPPPPSQRPQPSQVQSIQQSQQQQQQSQPQPKTRPSASCIPCRNRKVKVPPPSFPPRIPIHSHSNNHNNHLLIITPPPSLFPKTQNCTTNVIKSRLMSVVQPLPPLQHMPHPLAPRRMPLHSLRDRPRGDEECRTYCFTTE